MEDTLGVKMTLRPWRGDMGWPCQEIMTFLQKLEKTIVRNNSLLCIGLDTDVEKIPKRFLTRSDPVFAFNKELIDQTTDLVCCYKANIAFYSAQGAIGLNALVKTVRYIHELYDLPFILDAKRADIGNTAEKYAEEAFDVFNADAVTVNPYLGFDAIEPFLKRKDKGVIFLCRTSNKSASDFQDLIVNDEPLYVHVAKKAVEWNKKYKNCLMAVGATWPEELKKIRSIAPDMFFLVPGIGVQSGDLEQTLRLGLTKKKSGLIIHSSRSIIYSNNPKTTAEELSSTINKYRE